MGSSPLDRPGSPGGWAFRFGSHRITLGKATVWQYRVCPSVKDVLLRWDSLSWVTCVGPLSP